MLSEKSKLADRRKSNLESEQILHWLHSTSSRVSPPPAPVDIESNLLDRNSKLVHTENSKFRWGRLVNTKSMLVKKIWICKEKNWWTEQIQIWGERKSNLRIEQILCQLPRPLSTQLTVTCFDQFLPNLDLFACRRCLHLWEQVSRNYRTLSTIFAFLSSGVDLGVESTMRKWSS